MLQECNSGKLVIYETESQEVPGANPDAFLLVTKPCRRLHNGRYVDPGYNWLISQIFSRFNSHDMVSVTDPNAPHFGDKASFMKYLDPMELITLKSILPHFFPENTIPTVVTRVKSDKWYIVKPSHAFVGSGDGIKIMRGRQILEDDVLGSYSSVMTGSGKASSVPNIVQELISPALTNGHKYDVRYYASIISGNGRIGVYIHKAGVMRVCTYEWDPENARDDDGWCPEDGLHPSMSDPNYKPTIRDMSITNIHFNEKMFGYNKSVHQKSYTSEKDIAVIEALLRKFVAHLRIPVNKYAFLILGFDVMDGTIIEVNQDPYLYKGDQSGAFNPFAMGVEDEISFFFMRTTLFIARSIFRGDTNSALNMFYSSTDAESREAATVALFSTVFPLDCTGVITPVRTPLSFISKEEEEAIVKASGATMHWVSPNPPGMCVV